MLPPLDDVVRRGARLADDASAHHVRARDLSILDQNQALSAFDRDSRIEEHADEREIARTDRDRYRHTGDRDERESWILGEHPQPELHVEPRHLRQRPPFFGLAVCRQDRCARLAHSLAVTEALCRRLASRFRSHAARDVVTRPLLEVKPQLLVDFLFGIFLHHRLALGSPKGLRYKLVRTGRLSTPCSAAL